MPFRPGFNPTWDAHFEFRIACPQLAFLEFVVKDQSSSGTNWKLGHFILPASSISEGIFSEERAAVD